MKKRISAIVLAVAVAVSLVACGSSTAPAGTDAAATETAATEEAAEEEIPELPLTKGEAVADTGDFTLTVPEGWLGIGDLDIDENGKYYIAPYSYTLVKGGESAGDQYEKPTLTIYYTKSKDAQTLYESNMSSSDENTELDVTVNGTKCLAFHNVMNLTVEGSDPYVLEYDNVYIPVSDSSSFRVTMLTYASSEGETGINVAAEDVMMIMESLKVK